MTDGPDGPEEVAAFLGERGWHGVRAVKRISYGEWSRAYSFRSDGQRYVVRFSTLDDDFRKDQFATRWASPTLPIPHVVEFCRAFEGFYAITEQVDGDYLDTLDAEHMRALLPSLFQTMDAVRAADLSGTQGFGLWNASGNAPFATWREALLEVSSDPRGSRVVGWRPRLEASPTGTQPFDRAFAWLTSIVDRMPNGRHLIHSDLLNYNVLTEGHRVSAVLDWGSAMYGDWVFDLAWLTFWQPWYPLWAHIDFVGEALHYFESIGLAVPGLEERLRCYEVVIGLDNQTYCAFKGAERWEQLETVARRTLSLCRI